MAQLMELSKEQYKFLLERVHVYNWWESPEKALEMPDLIVAKIMNTGQLEDIKRLVNTFSEKYLIEILQNARLGQFSGKSWAMWHYMLLKTNYDDIPNLPTRRA